MVQPWSTTVESDGACSHVAVPLGAEASSAPEPQEIKQPSAQDVQDGAVGYTDVSFANVRLQQHRKRRSTVVDGGTISLIELLAQSPEEMLCCQDKDGDNELMIAIIKRHDKYAVFIIEVLVSRRKQKLLDIRNSLGQAALHLAVKTNALDVTKALVAAEVSLDLRDNEGYTPLHCACAKGFVHQVGALTSSHHQQFYKECAESMDYKGWNCIHIATMGSYTEVVEVLVKHVGADVNKRGGSRGMTALHHAVILQDIPMMLFLVHVAKADVNVLTYDNWSPLELALGFGYDQFIQPLLTNGASPGDVSNFRSKLAMMEEDSVQDDDFW